MIGIFTIAGVLVVIGIWILLFVLHKASFKYHCQIAVPVGESADDVVWENDRFKTRIKKGHTEVSFLKNGGKVYAPDFKFWGKWSKKNKTIPQKDDVGWARIDDPDIRKHLLRGAHFYRVSDKEYKVIKIDKLGNFKVLDHDSMELIIDDIERQNEITVSFKDKLIQLGTWLGSILIISVLAIMIVVLTFKYAGERSTEIIQLAKAAAIAQPGVGG